MAVHQINKGLDLPITGGPKQNVEGASPTTSVATMAADYVGMKPRMAVKVGDEVKRGQLLFEDRKTEGVRHTALAAGRIAAVNRGDFRALQSIVIEMTDAEIAGETAPGEHVELESYKKGKIDKLSRDDVVALLVESGLWATMRTRPFSRSPLPSGEPPHALFVTATDTHPLAPDVDVVMKGREDDFAAGLEAVAKLASKTFVCVRAGAKFRKAIPKAKGLSVEEFDGLHPAGTVGLHIHTLAPVSRKRTAWHLNYQQVISIGRLFRTGTLDHERVISLAGPQVEKPRLLTTRVGANLDQVSAKELKDGETRVISGSVLSGRSAVGDVHGYLGMHHNQVSALREGREREFLGWLTPGFDAFSTAGIYLSALNPSRKFDFTTTTNGSKRAMVPIGMYERVFPFDILPTFLLRAILKDDLERAEELGVLELDEEDVALCTFVCPGKHDYGSVLRHNLETIWKEG